MRKHLGRKSFITLRTSTYLWR